MIGAITSLFVEKMSQDEKEKFKKEFKRIYEKERIKFCQTEHFRNEYSNQIQEQDDIIDVQKVLIAYAQKY